MAMRQFEPGCDHDTEFYWEGTKSGVLLVQRCSGCGSLRHPPSPVCPHCQSLEWEAEEAPTRGVLYSVSMVHHPPSPFQPPGYLLCLVDLVAGVRVAANLRGCTLAHARIGMAVELFFEPGANGFQLPQFRPAR
jgi:uncharacterized OB-fold protein